MQVSISNSKIKNIGRQQEQHTLLRAFHSDEPEMVAVFGRRRVGKTFLVRTVFSEQIDFEVIGVQNAILYLSVEVKRRWW